MISVTAIASNKSTAYANIKYDCDKCPCPCPCPPVPSQMITPTILFSDANNFNDYKPSDSETNNKIETHNIPLINLQT